MAKDKKIQIRVDDNFTESIERLKNKTGLNQSEIIEKAVELYEDLIMTKEEMKLNNDLDNRAVKSLFATLVLKKI